MTTGEVYIVDDDDAVRDSIAMLLRSVGQSSEGFASGQAFLETYKGQGPACALFDMRMPGMGGMELLRQVRARSWQIPVIFITGHGDVPMAVEAMKMGALDFLSKPFREEELLERVQQALALHARDCQANEAKSAVLERFSSLTPREKEIARRIADGQANKVISMELEISLRTVELHRARVMEKMQADSVADLVRSLLESDQGN